ncbi:MAG TPA: cadherin domain-containing protein, partial [Candidatus Binatia bacterium]|nr:cadherin domain-containing protein [Candidatus Binatia bacterium]
MNARYLLLAAGVLTLSGALYFARRHATTRSNHPAEPPARAAAVAPGASQPLSAAPAQTPGTNQGTSEFDLSKNPYAASLREPSKSKRAWDPRFLRDLTNAASGEPIRFELTDGVMASGTIKLTQYREGELTYISGELDQPDRGKFFFLTPPPGGKAGKAAGVIEFPASQTSYRIEPTGPNGDPELRQRRLDEVLCQSMPPVDETIATNESVNIPPLRPDTVPDYIPSYNSNIVSLQSYPGSSAVLLLDFFGGYTPTWGGVSYARPNVSNAQIKDLWKRVAEDFMPFNINVTTDLRVYQNAPISSRQKCVFTISASTNPLGPGGAGVAYVGSWNWGSDTVCWSGYSSGKAGGEVGAHEPGHTLGLSHETTDINGVHTEYFTGQGSGVTGWAPIMGAGYYQPVTTWAKGEYQYAGNLQDQVNIIVTQNNNVTNRADDTGSTLATSRYLEVYAGFTASAEGVIERAADTDAFQFTTAGGQVSLTANPVGDWADLALMATLANASDIVINSNNPQTSLSATITTNLPAGTYTFRVTGAGRNSPLTNGFSAYSSLGYYSITGSVAGARLPTRLSVAEHAPNGTLVGTVPANNVFGSPLAYAIRSGNNGSTFSIDAAGAVRVASNTLLDYYRLATNTMLPVQFELLVNITNLANSALTELNRRVVIAVLNVNDAPLVAGFTNSVLEHSQLGLALGTVTATDPDFFETLSFSIVGGNTNGAFAIDQNGLVTVAANLNAASQNVYNLLIAASDNFPGNPLVSTGFVTINVVTNLTPFQPGTISYALYDNIGSGQLVSDLTTNARFPNDPTSEKQMPTFEGDSNRAVNYGA